MRNENSIVAAVGAASVTKAVTAPRRSVQELIAQIRSTDDPVRGWAWQGASVHGADAVTSLVDVMVDADFEIARAAKRALWKIVRNAGRPGADSERRAVQSELLPLLNEAAATIQPELVWMLSEIGGDESVRTLAALLGNTDLREHARAALERLPGEKSIAALNFALAAVPDDYKPAIAHSLRVRGIAVSGYPSQKLVPRRQGPPAFDQTPTT